MNEKYDLVAGNLSSRELKKHDEIRPARDSIRNSSPFIDLNGVLHGIDTVLMPQTLVWD